MSYVKSEPTRRELHIWSPARVSVGRAYHEIWSWVKRTAPTSTSWGRGETSGIAEKTVCKAAYQLCRLLHNDKGGIALELVDKHSWTNWPKIVREGAPKRDDQASTHWSWARSCGGYPSYRVK
jgi:hypothetical protein